jgi:hypoxanthine phosphoribosyltransferase
MNEALLTEQKIKARIQEIAETITQDYQGKDVIAVCVLKGAYMFFSDLMRLIDLPFAVDFIMVSSYVKTESSGEVKVHYNMREDVRNKDVLIIDDIVDTGFTIKYITDLIAKQAPKTLKVCTLLNKKSRREVETPLDYVGFEIPDLFVVGYGMDYENQHRNLPFIKVIEK